MAGRPKLEEASEIIEQWGGIDELCERVMGGDTVVDISRDIGVSKGLLYRWIGKADYPERAELYGRARDKSGDAHADMALDTAIERDKSRMHQWLAGVRDPKYRVDKGPVIAISTGDLHLTSLQSGDGSQGQLPGGTRQLSSGVEPQ